jgi:hypothetical protein
MESAYVVISNRLGEEAARAFCALFGGMILDRADAGADDALSIDALAKAATGITLTEVLDALSQDAVSVPTLASIVEIETDLLAANTPMRSVQGMIGKYFAEMADYKARRRKVKTITGG